MMRVEISSQPARMEISTQPATLSIDSEPAKLEITAPAAQVEISQPKGTLSIDNYPSRAAIGLKNSFDMLAEFTQYGQQAVRQMTARYVEDGNRLARITSGGNTVGQIAAERSAAPQLDITWAYVPLPNIRYQMNPPEISVTPGKLDIRSQPFPVQLDSTPGKVNSRVAQYASIDIQATGTRSFMDVQA